MNYRAMAHNLGVVLKLEAVLMLVALAVSLFYGETVTAGSFLISAAVIFLAGAALSAFRDKSNTVRLRESYVLIAICWIAVALFGSLPYILSGTVGSAIDCIFESVSGFTTTAASVVSNVEALPRGILFWRSLSLWVGGVGVLLFLAAATSVSWGEGTSRTLGAENPGPIPGKLVPRLKSNARILYGIYAGLTGLEAIFLLFGGMSLFDSVLTSMATVGTGGFSVRNMSIAAYNSAYIECVVVVFMILSGMNLNIHFFLLTRNIRGVRMSDELRAYFGIMAASVVLVALNLWGPVFPSFFGALRTGGFHVVSIMTTTGFTDAAIASWPEFSKMVLFLLMFIGACAGSSGGGLKVARIVILAREAKRALLRMIRPRAVTIVRFDGKAMDYRTLHATNVFFVTYFIIYIFSFLLLSLENLDFESTATLVAACMNNVGSGLGIMADTGSFDLLSPLSKLVLCLNMLIGRLEIYPVLILFSPRTWRRL